MKRVDFSLTKITGGFWKQKQDMVRDITIKAVYDRFKETGRFDAFKCDTGLGISPHIFWDSDVAKWVEGVGYLLRERKEPHLEAIVDELADDIEKNQLECGYFNSYYLVNKDKKIFSDRDCHELYCLGHLIEGAVAYYEATGKDKLLKCVCRYADYVEKVFKINKETEFTTPGHEELELALVRLYECTDEKRYLELAKFFVDERGLRHEDKTKWYNRMFNQSHKPVREQETAEGHAVRAVYLYCAMADLALKYNDSALKSACEKIFDNIISKKMYITGGIGSSYNGEAFTVDYDLPNLTAYAESCASLGLALFAHRMLLLDNNSKYSDTVERALYNGFMSSISLDGDKFFYCNPLEILPYMRKRDVSNENKNGMFLPCLERQKVFECSCCPPNIVRFIPSVANLIYTQNENTIYIHQFMQSETKIKLENCEIELEQKTNYPFDGKVEITVKGGRARLAVRVPYFCDEYEDKADDGYIYYEISDTPTTISLDFGIKPRFVYSNDRVLENANKCAVICGPLVYCMEGCDHSYSLRNILLDDRSEIARGFDDVLGLPVLYVKATAIKSDNSLYSFTKGERNNIQAKLIPYFAFANRGVCEMQVWHNLG
ncbi:MAG: glycoside hydrolase family 127 protein [Clostridia bacterium]|nr:glycoside hydrolase family 127 protein [Clostridia bacterium]